MTHLDSFILFAREDKVKILNALGVNYLLITVLICIMTSCSAKPAPVTGPQVSSLCAAMDNNYPSCTFLDEQGNMQGILIDQWNNR
jgi:hypothetical protein